MEQLADELDEVTVLPLQQKKEAAGIHLTLKPSELKVPPAT